MTTGEPIKSKVHIPFFGINLFRIKSSAIPISSKLIGLFSIALFFSTFSVVNAQSYTEDFEGTESDWYVYKANSPDTMDIKTTDETNAAYSGSESLHASRSLDGACGITGMAKDFNLSSSPESLTLWVKATSDDW